MKKGETMPKVSVIIPVYNVEKYLRECLDSVVNQTLKDIEIILIDDGSTDSSLDICKEYQNKYCNIVLLQQKNSGSGKARNAGMDIAKGEFVIFLDSDDYYPESDILEVLYNSAIEQDVMICGGSFASLQDSNITTIFGKEFYGYTFEKNEVINYVDWQFDYGYHRFIYNLQFLKDNKLTFPDYRRFQDPPFFVQAMYLAKKFYALSKITYLLREGHKTEKWTVLKQKGMLDGILFNLKFAKTNKLKFLYKNTVLRLKQHAFVLIDSGTFTTRLKFLYIILRIGKNYIKNDCPELISDIRKIFKILLQKLFSLRNENNHKVLTILGVKFKFRRKNKNINEYKLT